jgi:hypothetical protein
MSLRGRYYSIAVVWLVLGLAIGVAFSGYRWMPFLFFGLVAAIAGYSISLRCPSCRKPIGLNPILGVWSWTPWVPQKCSKCNYDLTKAR